MLNPSTSTAEKSDPTVHNCELFARNWGFTNLVVTNLFARVTGKPNKLETIDDPVGPSNNEHLIQAAHEADLRVAARGGRHERYLDRAIWLRIRMHLEGLDLKILHLNQDYTKIWNSHLVDIQDDGINLLYIDRHLLHEVLSP